MRLFLGIDLPFELKEKIAKETNELKTSNKGWENPADYHLTLLFIGESNSAQLADIISRMQQIQCEPFQIMLNGFHFFNRRIFYIGAQPNQGLNQIRDQIKKNFSEWAKLETKDYIPHITIKRWQRYEYDELSQKVASRSNFSADFLVSRISLFKSEKDENGKKYHIIDSRDF